MNDDRRLSAAPLTMKQAEAIPRNSVDDVMR